MASVYCPPPSQLRHHTSRFGDASVYNQISLNHVLKLEKEFWASSLAHCTDLGPKQREKLEQSVQSFLKLRKQRLAALNAMKVRPTPFDPRIDAPPLLRMNGGRHRHESVSDGRPGHSIRLMASTPSLADSVHRASCAVTKPASTGKPRGYLLSRMSRLRKKSEPSSRMFSSCGSYDRPPPDTAASMTLNSDSSLRPPLHAGRPGIPPVWLNQPAPPVSADAVRSLVSVDGSTGNASHGLSSYATCAQRPPFWCASRRGAPYARQQPLHQRPPLSQKQDSEGEMYTRSQRERVSSEESFEAEEAVLPSGPPTSKTLPERMRRWWSTGKKTIFSGNSASSSNLPPGPPVSVSDNAHPEGCSGPLPRLVLSDIRPYDSNPRL